MIFICHSLGGLLVKEVCAPFLGRFTQVFIIGRTPTHSLQLLIILGGPDSDDEDRANLNATLGALFFGVPNRGMDNTALLSIIKEQPNVEFLDSLSIGSTFLENQASVFPKIFDRRDSVIYSFYETCVSGTAMMVQFIIHLILSPEISADTDPRLEERKVDDGRHCRRLGEREICHPWPAMGNRR